jgi:hypothetical protein
MNQINRLRSARWVLAFGTILEVDRNRPLPTDARFRANDRKTSAQKEKAHD